MIIENQLEQVLNITVNEINDLDIPRDFNITDKTIQIQPNEIKELEIKPNSMIYLLSMKSPGIYRRDMIGTDYIENYCLLSLCKISVCEISNKNTGFDPDVIVYSSITIPKCIQYGYNLVTYFVLFGIILICAIILTTYLWVTKRI